jgi:hypothetical protein
VIFTQTQLQTMLDLLKLYGVESMNVPVSTLEELREALEEYGPTEIETEKPAGNPK